MQKQNVAVFKCPNSEHTDDVKLVCFDESCKANKLYCIQCIRNGIHVSHPQYQKEIPQLLHHIQRIQEECEDLINRMIKQMDQAYEQFYLLIDGIRSKYQKSQHQFLNLNSKQMNSFFTESIQFQSFELNIQIQFHKSIKDFQNEVEALISDLQLSELNYYQISKSDINQSEEMYQKGNKSIKLGYQLYFEDNNFQGAIKLFDQQLILNSKHQLSLWCKAASLRLLGKYHEAIIWADKALSVNPKHFDSIYCKADSLRMLEQYNEAIIWADKILSIEPKYCCALYCKAECLKMLGKYNQAMTFADRALALEPKCLGSLFCKAECLRMLGYQNEAIVWADKVLQVDPKHSNSLYCKSACLLMNRQYNEAIIWAEKAISLNPKNCNFLQCKSESLRLMNMFKEAMEVIEQSLQINKNNFSSLLTKGLLLQHQNQYQRALKYFEKALLIKPNYQLAKDRKNECLIVLNEKKD